jgi:hypothetical protein
MISMNLITDFFLDFDFFRVASNRDVNRDAPIFEHFLVGRTFSSKNIISRN